MSTSETAPTGAYVACRRDEIAVKLANLAMRLATPEYRAGIWRWREDGIRYHRARIALSDACTGAVLEGWRWWRPSYSQGRYDGLTDALTLVEGQS